MIIKNCNIIYLNKIEKGSVLVKDGKIDKINPEVINNDQEIINAEDLFLSPGFIDVHIHGAGGYDTMDGTEEAINNIAKTIVKHGTTSFVPTTMTMSIEDIHKAVTAVKAVKEKGSDGAIVLGAHLEGPFINPKAIGAQNPKYLIKPCAENYDKMVAGCEDSIVSITVAPEVPGCHELIEYLSSKGITCRMGHTKATYEEAIEGIKCGISFGTHLFNAMTGFTHREPGTVGAIFDSNITTETIADGVHISYPALRITYRQKTTDNVLLISDAMMACCMDDGDYSLGGQKVILKNNAARLENGALAGSVLTLDKAVKNVYENCNIPLNEAVKMASYNGAKHCGIDDHKGLIKEGYDADLVLFDKDINVKKVFVKGMLKFSK